MDDRVLIHRGADQPDMSVINPESDVWQRIKVRLIVFAVFRPDIDRVLRYHKIILLQTGQYDIQRSVKTVG